MQATRQAAQVIGRERELAVVDEFLDGTAKQALVLSGEPGIGKTSIVRAALARAAAKGLRTSAARPTAGEMELPYVGLGDLLATVQPASLASLPGRQRAAVEAALGRERPGAAVDEHALLRGVLGLLDVEAREGDLLLAVDDVQWLDRPTSSALTFALRRLGATPMRVLVAARAEDGPASDAPFGLSDWEGVRQLVVGPMSTTELGALVRERLGQQLPRPRLEALRQESAGNPMFALELAHGASGGDAGPSGLPSAVKDRLRAVDLDARVGLSFASAALRPSTELLLRAGVDRAQLRAALETAILESEGERLSFAHPLLRAAAYELLLPEERREIHGLLAAATADVVEQGHHVSRSAVPPDETAAEMLDQAAEEAANLGDHAGAAAFLVRAAELSPDPTGEDSALRQVRAAWEFDLAGDVGAAAALARRLIDGLPPGVARARARQVLVHCSSGPELSLEEGLAELALAFEDAGDDEAVEAELHVSAAEPCSSMFLLEQAVAHSRTAVELADRAGASATAVAALAELGLCECLLGHGVTEAARLAYARWDSSVTVNNSPRVNLALALMIATEFDEAEELLRRELELTEERGFEPLEVLARGVMTEVQIRAGRWAEALPNARLALEHARQAAIGQFVIAASYAVGMLEALLGRDEEARAIATQALPEAETAQDTWHRISHRAVLGLVAITEDDAEEAVRALTPAWTLMVESELGDLSILPVAQVLGEALVALGRLDDALRVAETLRACPVGERPWCRAMSSRIAALAASARGHHDAARRVMAAALEAHAELPEPFEHARALHIAGRLERSARNWGAARSALVDALERFDSLGAARWAEKTAADIARLPGRRPRDERELTTRERDVAELVAEGLSNKEIAARLFVSVRTVEANLSKVYAKVCVRSRTELASRLRS